LKLLCPAGRLNIVVGRRPVPTPARLHFHPLRPDAAIVIAGVSHPLSGRRGLTLEDLVEFPWMRPSRGVWARQVFDTLFDGTGKRPRLHQISTASLAPLPEILSDNQTLALLPASLGRSLCRWKVAVELDVGLGTPVGEIGMICATEALQESVYQEFLAELRAD
jgi:DNA-binding transcriptional LysR family regulator